MRSSRQMAFGALGAFLLPVTVVGLPIATALAAETHRAIAFLCFLLMVGFLSCVGYALGRVQ